MRKGVSFTLTVVVIGLILLTTALTVILGGTNLIGSFFDTSGEEISDADCDLQTQRVESGRMAPEDMDEACRTQMSEENYNELSDSYTANQVEDDIT